MYIKIKDQNPSIKSTRQMKAGVDKTQRKKKKKNQQSRKNKERKPNANMTQGYEMMINDNKEDLRRESCLPQID